MLWAQFPAFERPVYHVCLNSSFAGLFAVMVDFRGKRKNEQITQSSLRPQWPAHQWTLHHGRASSVVRIVSFRGMYLPTTDSSKAANVVIMRAGITISRDFVVRMMTRQNQPCCFIITS